MKTFVAKETKETRETDGAKSNLKYWVAPRDIVPRSKKTFFDFLRDEGYRLIDDHKILRGDLQVGEFSRKDKSMSIHYDDRDFTQMRLALDLRKILDANCVPYAESPHREELSSLLIKNCGRILGKLLEQESLQVRVNSE